MTKDEFDSLEEGDEAELGGTWYVLKKCLTRPNYWLSQNGKYGLDEVIRDIWGGVRKKNQANQAIQDLSGWYLEAGRQIELRLALTFAGYTVHGKSGLSLIDVSQEKAVDYIQRGVWVKQPTPGKLFGVDETRQYSYPVKVKRPEKAPPKISDYPHRCDCGSPAFAGILTVDCQAKCSKPNVRNV